MNIRNWMLICLLLATLVLAACADDEESDDATPTATAAAQATATEPSAGDGADATATPEAEATATEEAATATTEPTEVVATPTDDAATPTMDDATATSAADDTTPTADSTADTEATPEATVFVDPEAEAALFEIALTEEDLPDGWTQISIIPLPPSSGGATFCGAEPYSSPEGRLAAVEAEFERDPNAGPFVYQNLTAYPEENAIEAMEHAQSVVASCDEWTDDDGMTYEISDLDLPDYGDDSFGIRVSLEVPGIGPVPTDLAFVRVGGILLSLGFVTIDEDARDQFEPIIEIAVEKMEDSDYRP